MGLKRNIAFTPMQHCPTHNLAVPHSVPILEADVSAFEGGVVQFVLDVPPKTWFRIETLGEAALESQLMQHAVEKYFQQAFDEATASYAPPANRRYIEQSIGRTAHIQRTMPMFMTLRDSEGKGLATAMLPPEGESEAHFRPIIVGPNNADPFPEHGEAIAALGAHLGLKLEPARCYPYRRR